MMLYYGINMTFPYMTVTYEIKIQNLSHQTLNLSLLFLKNSQNRLLYLGADV